MTPHDQRRGLVLGGGGVLGAAWMVGALTALEDHLGVDVAVVRRDGRDVGRFGAVRAAGVRRQRRRAAHAPDGGVAHLRPAGRLRVGLRREHRRRPAAGSARRVRVRRCCCASRFASCASCRRWPCSRRSCPRAGAGWTASARWCATSSVTGGSSATGLTVVALDYDLGVAGAVRPRRGAGGRGSRGGDGLVRDPRVVPAGDASTSGATSTAARGRRPTSTSWPGLGLDEVYVLAPQASFDLDAPA